ncbi:hypothetical protein TCE0_017f04050 [Talaromyces pinophilus]|uniref:Carrier domain-containing protein n=1 Tax=Talaromyces pinophilus TaxID=128442 RepID=A0A6V8H2Q5_TALPI|nr:hypothetical protein TCE0_017f04050 [Talaromyces pinophilus]
MPNRRTAAKPSLLPTIVDQLARDQPNGLWGEYPKSKTTLGDGYEELTYKQFANAVNGVAHQIEKQIGRRDTREPLAYIAANDPRCSIALIAAMKVGCNLFLLSERNSVAANLKLLEDTGCSVLLITDRTFAPVRSLLSETTLEVVELLPLHQLLHEQHSDYVFTNQLAEMRTETAFTVHTSGSTGFPKPVRISCEYMSRMIQNMGLEAPPGYEMFSDITGNNRCILLLPLGHNAGIYFGVLNAFFNNTTVILPIPGVPPNGELLLEMLRYRQADWAAVAPLTLEEISKNATLLNEISKRLKMVAYSGGSLPKVFGDVIASKIKLTTQIGSSECGPIPTMYRNGYDFKKDWNYLQIHPSVGAKFDPLPGDLFELIWERSPECEPFQTVFTIYPGLDVYRTKDLFTPHPELLDVWTHASRSDDIIVFLNGEKVNPIGFESSICRHPNISAALMFGYQRFEAGLLIQPSDPAYPHTTVEKARFVQDIWPIIEQANSILPAYAQISPSHICFTEPDYPILRTLKGSIRRSATLEQYATKINQMYADVEQMWAPGTYNSQDIKAMETIENVTKRAILQATKWTDVEANDNFFERGMDSLQVLKLVRNLRVETSIRTIQPSTIYLRPTVTALALDLKKQIIEDSNPESNRKGEQLSIMSSTLKGYMDKIDQLHFDTETPATAYEMNKQVVLLTGSTGSIGSYILNALQQEDRVSHIYCLNRSADSSTLQQERNKFLDSNLPTYFPKNNVTFLSADLSESTSLGLSKDVYTTLTERTTLVIHNAWMVNFNAPLQTFDSQLSGILNLCSLCGRSALKARFVFISSISSVMNLDQSYIPESITTDMNAPPSVGYSESKYIAERLLAHAASKHDLGVKILRLGIIAGASRSNGRWNSADWIPALILGSKALGALPGSLSGSGIESEDIIDWVPIDVAADVIVELSLGNVTDPNHGINVFHILNPHQTTWKTLVPSITASLQSSAHSSIQVVSPAEWISNLRISASTLLSSNKDAPDEATISEIRENPALKLIAFFDARFGDNYQGHVTRKWEYSRAEQASRSLRSAPAIDETMMTRWIGQWIESQLK